MFCKLHSSIRTEKGFTLVELLVVIGIIGILAMLLLPQFRSMRDRARIAACQSNLKNIGTQLETEYVDNDSYPTQAVWGTLVSAGTLRRLGYCPANTSVPYDFIPNPAAGSIAATGVIDFDAIPDGAGTTVTGYVVDCLYHNGKPVGGVVTFPQSVQLFITQDGLERRDLS